MFTIDGVMFKPNTKEMGGFVVKASSDYTVYFTKFLNQFYDNQVVLVDKKVRELYGINHYQLIEIEAIEEHKTIDTVLDVCEQLINFKFDKGHTLVVIGGGIIQDIGAYVAKTFKRGIDWIYIPTTLLSQCDSCIGGKTALNFRGYKNQLGLFSSPRQVIIDTKFLDSMSQEQLMLGSSEIIKMFILGGEYYFDKLFTIEQTIYHSLMIKKAIIEHDEFEHHERKALNYGHSFGHAIEAASGYRISHGEAVLYGMLIISKMFHVKDIAKMVSNHVSLDNIKHLKDDIMFYLREDKKVTNGVISLVVATEPGKTVFIDKTLEEVGEKLCDIF